VRTLKIRSKNLSDCNIGEIIAEDIVIDGAKLIARNTVLNSYILSKLQSYYIFQILVYEKDETLNINHNEEVYKRIKESYELSIMDIKSIITQMASGETPDYKRIKHAASLIIEMSESGSDILKHLHTLKEKDEYTYTHCINVAVYAMLIGKWLNLSGTKVEELVQAGLLHDVGKIRVPREIIKKPGRLTSEEFFEIKKHTIYGFDIINLSKDISPRIKDAILMHHERLDGTGYPLGLTYSDITLFAKIVSVADVFDAMTSNRVYKNGTTPFRAFEMFMVEGFKLFDTKVLFTLLENLSAYYIGMKVMLDSGEVGEIVYIPPRNVLSPIIKVNDEFIDFSDQDISRIVKLY
jgi:putative nucleotidyltransferase with HDIG domain